MGGARIDNIARRSGSNKRMIYHYFGDKEGLYAEVLDHAFARMRSAEQSLDFDLLTPMEGVEKIARFIWQYFLTNPEILSLLGTENLHQARFLDRSSNGKLLNHQLVRKLQALIRHGQADGVMKGDIDALKVFLTMLSMSFFYLSNRYTLSTMFNKDLEQEDVLARWEDHIVHVVSQSLR
ncbi:TetR/AcrR family transcriptional regulator (plasmid) [Sinorhizobium mexicanum]|uniref:TetR/AcrR family transcriptional regulator n=2 Tax=Sinorhizobium mexicanum TaxID=375549 RepID=A0A859QMA4_9HYPH|nr:TetR/AcrR family transcriptional regulator [Sinorhizobium mexicanum]